MAGRGWEEGRGNSPAVSGGGRGQAAMCVCWWGHIPWYRDKREGSAVPGGNWITSPQPEDGGDMLQGKGRVVWRGAGCAQRYLGTQHPKWEKILINSGSPWLGLKSQPGPGISHLTFSSASNLWLLLSLFSFKCWLCLDHVA